MKAPARMFQLSDWYGSDWDHKKPADDLWVSPWAKAHYKLRQQEIEIEQCEMLLQTAVEAEDYAEADGLKERVERLRSQHPILPREERLTQAIEDENYGLAAIFQKDLDTIKKSLGLPQYAVGQAVVHAHREGLRGIVVDADLQCVAGRYWVEAAGCLERGCALGYPAYETDMRELKSWCEQPFYLVMPDLDDAVNEEAQEGTWRWRWPEELAAWEVNYRDKLPAPLYLPEEALMHDPDGERPHVHPESETLFGGFDVTPHRGRVYRPTGRLRLWQQQRAKDQQDVSRQRATFTAGDKNPYDRMR